MHARRGSATPFHVFFALLLGAMLAGGPIGCKARAVSREVGEYITTADLQGLRLDTERKPEWVFIRPGAPGFENYDRYIVGPILIDYRDPDMAELSGETIEKIESRLRVAISRELREGGYTVTTRVSPGTMRMSFVVSGFSAPAEGAAINAAVSVAGSLAGVPAFVTLSTGEVTIEGIFSDAFEKRIDAVAVDRSAGARILNGNPLSTWADVDAAFEKWAKGIRERVDTAHEG